jgi:endoglucanase
MEPGVLAFLKSLVDADGPTGYETNVQRVFKGHVECLGARTLPDAYGNVVARIDHGAEHGVGYTAPRLLFVAHADELGFQVRNVDKEGFIWFGPLGGFDEKIVPGRNVIIHTENGAIPGVIGSKAVHAQTSKEYEEAGKIKGMWIDIGAKDKARALELVAIGDPITYCDTFRELDGKVVAGRGFDDKAGLFSIARSITYMRRCDLHADLSIASVVQEEIGFYGAKMVAQREMPNLAIVVDVCWTSDCPEMEENELGEIKLGGGPIIARGPKLNHKMVSRLISLAKENDLPYQILAESGDTGTDADVIQTACGGVPTALISIPNRYTHTPVELVSLDDLENTAKLLAAFAHSVKADDNWNVEI